MNAQQHKYSNVSGDAMTTSKSIPADINERMIHFKEEVKKYFSFLADFGYCIEKVEAGRTENFLDYYCNIAYNNGDTHIRVDYSTDIINGRMMAFPKEKQRPVIDDLIFCAIRDPNAYMVISQFAEEAHFNLPKDCFSISVKTDNIRAEITRVLQNFSDFTRTHLRDVLKKEKIYDCYTDRFYDKVFKEKHYR